MDFKASNLPSQLLNPVVGISLHPIKERFMLPAVPPYKASLIMANTFSPASEASMSLTLIPQHYYKIFFLST